MYLFLSTSPKIGACTCVYVRVCGRDSQCVFYEKHWENGHSLRETLLFIYFYEYVLPEYRNVYICICMCMYIQYIYIYVYAYTYICFYTCQRQCIVIYENMCRYMRFYLHTCAYCYIYIFMYVTIIVYMYMIYIDSIHLNVVSHHSVLASSQLIGFRFFVVHVVKVSTHNWHGTYIIVVSKALFRSVLLFQNSDLTSSQFLSSLSVTVNLLRSSTSDYQAHSRLSSKRITF